MIPVSLKFLPASVTFIWGLGPREPYPTLNTRQWNPITFFRCFSSISLTKTSPNWSSCRSIFPYGIFRGGLGPSIGTLAHLELYFNFVWWLYKDVFRLGACHQLAVTIHYRENFCLIWTLQSLSSTFRRLQCTCFYPFNLNCRGFLFINKTLISDRFIA